MAFEGKGTALKEVDLVIDQSECTCVLGKNGAGLLARCFAVGWRIDTWFDREIHDD